MFRRILLITVALTALFGVHAAEAQDTTCPTHDVYGCGTPGFILNPPTTNVGGQITISGQGCDANQLVEFSINGQKIGETITGPDGTFTVTLTLPTTLGPGSYTIIGTCGDITMSNVITIEAGGSAGGGSGTPGGGTLVPTGSGITRPLVTAGVVLIVGGGFILIGSKRRRGEPEAAPS